MVNLGDYKLLLVLVSIVPTARLLDVLPQCSTVRLSRSTCIDVLNSTHAYPQIALVSEFAVVNDFISTFITLSSVLMPPIPDTCLDVLQHFLCIGGAPPCGSDTGLPVLICEEDCNLYKQIKEAGFCDVILEREALLLMATSFVGFKDLSRIFTEFDCFDPLTYFFLNVTQPEPNSCTSIFTPETRETFEGDLCDLGIGPNCTVKTSSSTPVENKGDSSLLLKAVLPPVLLVLLAVTITLLLLLTCYFRHRKRKQPENPEIAMKTISPWNIATTRLLPNQQFRSRSYDKRVERENGQQNGVKRPEINAEKGVTGRNGVVGGVKEDDAMIEQYKQTFGKFTILYSDLVMGKILGQGCFSKVFEGELHSSGDTQTTRVAVKIIKSGDLKSLLDESVVMKDFSHPNVLRLVGVVFDTPDGTPHLVLPFMENGNLKNFLKSKREISSKVSMLPQDLQISDLVRMCLNIASGMKYLAEKKFVHRDLAARNCMLDEDLHVKVGDFGLSRDIYTTDYYRISDKSAKLPVKWMPPETFNDGISNEKTDVWAFGVTCWEVFSLGRTPYPTIPNSETFAFISEGGRLERPACCPNNMFDIFVKCWQLRPEERPNFANLMNSLSEYWDDNHSYVT